MIKDLKAGMSADGIYLIKDSVKGVTAKGLNYLNITLQDSSGTIEAKKWDADENDFEVLQKGSIVEISAEVIDYKDKPQVKIFSASFAKNSENLIKSFLVDSPISADILIDKFKKLFKSVENPDCKAILNKIFEKYYSKFIEYPAAVKNHHEFYHGLLYHTVSMCEIADFLAEHYDDVNRDILISGCLLHDIGKVIELSGPIATKYTDEGNLLGHLTIGMSLVREVANELNITSDVPLQLEHMILSHHGKLEYGAAVLPQTKEALLLSMIDDMDAKMMILAKAYQNIKPGEYTDRIFALDNRTFYKSK